MHPVIVYWNSSLAGKNGIQTFGKRFLCWLARWQIQSLLARWRPLKPSAGWESDNFKILLAGGEERVFFSQESKILDEIDVATLR